MKFELPKLPYAYDALEPYIDTLTMQIHYTKHHKTYLDNLNKALAEIEQPETSIVDLLKNLNRIPESDKSTIRNSAGGYYNHNIFWSVMTDKYIEPSAEITKVVEDNFNSLTNFQKLFSDCALKIFGSGWAWLVINGNKLEITATINQDNPVSNGEVPILGLDVWEHAYYLKYQNNRADYIKNWWNVVNWSAVEENYKHGKNY